MENKFHEYTPKNVNINKAYAVADSRLIPVMTMENFRRFLGVHRVHESFYNLVCEDDKPLLAEKVASLEAGNEACVYLSTQMLRSDGEKRRVSLRIALMENPEDRGVYSIELIDSLNSHDYIYDLEYKALRYKTALENQGSMLYQYNPQSDVFKVSSLKQTCEEVIYSTELKQLQGQIHTLDLPNEDKDALALFITSLINGEAYVQCSFTQNPFDKSAEGPVVAHGSIAPLTLKQNVAIGTIGSPGSAGQSFAAISGSVDMMTGLLNKRAILELARSAIENKRYNQVFLVMLDLDNFKTVNDTYGHMAGDTVIKRVSEILKINVKQNGQVGRFGGDEYLAVLYNLGGEGDLRAILGSIMDNVEDCGRDIFEGFSLSCSMGIAEYPRNGSSFDLLFKKADRGLYIAKKKGKKRYIIYKEELHGEIDLSDKGDEEIKKLDTKRFAGDIKHYELIRDGITRLALEGRNAVDQFMNDIVTAYSLTGVSLYLGEGFTLKRQWGRYRTPMPDADYMLQSAAVARFNKKDIFWENNVQFNGNYVPVIHDKLLKYGINSTVQCIIRRDGEILGIMTFDMEVSIRNWNEEDTSYFGIVSQLVGNLLL